ncbi:MAG: Asp-tRNA(Asn)/Glu-tRNA(Gln) amidotransferase subunit GatA [Planctomycetota bacterium]|nr:Asp-tRNA(Asn)/Glu-tRNA(Gln) amidotransferase subunit GatA [Planctomycetota bacterium]
MTMDAHDPSMMTMAQQAAAIRAKTLSSRDATRHALNRLAASEPKVHAFLQVFEDRAMEQAAKVDAGEVRGPLAGVPIALKDNICLNYGRTTCASRMLEQYESPYTATAAQRLIDAGAIVIGKTNLDEFAMGSSTENSAFGPTRNPWDVSRVPGGSSGGSAAAVAAGVVPMALGSDTGGSIRQPAALCNLVGVKPTYGRVSRYGLVAFASSLDQIGPLTRDVTDAALTLEVICGSDALDATSAPEDAPRLVDGLETPIAGLRIGVPTQCRSDANHGAVNASLDATLEVYRRLGATIVDVDLPLTDYGIAAYYIVAPAEASSNLARFDGVRYGHRAALGPGEGLIDLYCRSRAEGFGPEVQRRIMLGTHVLSSGYYDAYYNTALKVRRTIKGDFDRVFSAAGNGCHVVLMPSTPGPAFAVGSKTSDPLAMYLEDVYTVGINLAGLPALSMPAGMVRIDGVQLPIGMQLVAQAFDEATLLRVARMFERETGFTRARASV